MPIKNIYIIGAGGLGKEVLQYIHDINRNMPLYNVLGFLDDDEGKKGKEYDNVEVAGSIEGIKNVKNGLMEVYAICAVANNTARRNLVKRAMAAGLKILSIIHPTAYISGNVKIGDGVIIGPYSVITADVEIKDHVIINPHCGIGHETKIGSYSTLYWNVNIGGNVIVGEGVEAGSKCFIKQGLRIGDGSIIGAGAVVIRDVESGTTVAGVPAHVI